MEENHRRLIDHHMNVLIESTDFELMKTELLNKQVLTQVMVDNIENDTKGQDEGAKLQSIFKKLKHRGPKAYQKLLEILKENSYNRAYNLLSSSTVPAQSYTNSTPVVTEDNRFVSISNTRTTNLQRTQSNTLPSSNVTNNNEQVPTQTDGNSLSKKVIKLEPYTAKTSFNIENLEVKKAEDFGKHTLLPVYSMKSRRRGVFFFVNIIKFQDSKTDRRGAERDHDNLVTLFREMGFTIFYYENLTKDQLMRLLRELVVSEYLQRIDSFFLCIQTHGDLLSGHTIMEFSDGSREYTDVIVAMFSNIDCPALVEKPKVFFFPFCRGKISDKLKNVYLKDLPMTETDGIAQRQFIVPTVSDILICYGTVPGFKTHRDTEFGSWYVREMCKVFAENAYSHHVEELLKLVGTNTMGIKAAEGLVQVASTESRGFNSLLYLNPKIWDP